jgi:hypothetical protein
LFSVALEYKTEGKQINKNLVRVRRSPRYSKEREEEAMRELEELSPYIGKVIEKSRHE